MKIRKQRIWLLMLSIIVAIAGIGALGATVWYKQMLSPVDVNSQQAFRINIKEANVKDQAKGKSYGEVQSAIESIEGVEDVDVKFSPFWVKSVPKDINKINVEFKIKDVK